MAGKPVLSKRIALSSIDSSRVDAAEARLRELFRDPYYQEAYERIRRKKELPNPLPNGGLLPPKGALARRIRRSASITAKTAPKPKKRWVFSKADDPFIDELILLAGEKKRSLPEIIALGLKKKFPNTNEQDIRKAAKMLAKKIHNRKGSLIRKSASK